VKSPALLDNVAAGDKVKFRAEEVKGDYVVTMIERAK
jgi:Cu/Ag efflux protein CusF